MSGLGSTANGAGAIATGISMFAFVPCGIAGGIVLIGIGLATAAFGVKEVIDHYSGTNYIQSFGMSDSDYNVWYIGLNIASSIGQIAGNIGMRYASNTKLNAVLKNPELIQSYSKFQFMTYSRYPNEWNLSVSRNGLGMRSLSIINKGNSIRYGYGINNATHYYSAHYSVVPMGLVNIDFHSYRIIRRTIYAGK